MDKGKMECKLSWIRGYFVSISQPGNQYLYVIYKMIFAEKVRVDQTQRASTSFNNLRIL